ncbi:ABC transporter G family member 45-like [Carex rostrata]
MKSRDEPPLTHADNEEFLGMLRERNQRMGGVRATQVEVRFENLTVEAEMQTGRQALPTLLNATLNGVEEIVKLSCFCAKNPIRILNELSGTLRPSR